MIFVISDKDCGVPDRDKSGRPRSPSSLKPSRVAATDDLREARCGAVRLCSSSSSADAKSRVILSFRCEPFALREGAVGTTSSSTLSPAVACDRASSLSMSCDSSAFSPAGTLNGKGGTGGASASCHGRSPLSSPVT